MSVVYNPDINYPKKILKALSQILDKKSISELIRTFGYILLSKSSKYQKAIMLVGYGANGKSIILSLIERLVGEENCSHVKLQDLGKNRFMAAELYGKMVNTYADVPATEIFDTSTFKTLVTGDTVYGEKKYHDPFSFNNTAKLIFSTNKIPGTFDQSYGFYRRWVIIPCRRLFVNDNKDEDLINKLSTEEELSGLLNLALHGLEKLIKEKGFEDKPIEDIHKEFEQDSETVKEFLEQKCYKINDKDSVLKNEDYIIDKEEFINAYNDFCKQKNPPLTPMPLAELENEILRYNIFDYRAMDHGRKKHYFKGVITKEAHARKLKEEQYAKSQTTLV